MADLENPFGEVGGGGGDNESPPISSNETFGWFVIYTYCQI